MSVEYHIFVSQGDSLCELEIPGEHLRIEYHSLFDAARHARMRSDGKEATIVVHDQTSTLLNRIPFKGSF